LTPTEELIKLFSDFWDNTSVALDTEVPIIKGKCSYCGLDVEFPYPQHEECIRIHIEVEKNAIKNKA